MADKLQLWWVFALLSAFFAALTTIFAKIGIKDVNSDLATAIRTIVILIIAWGIVFWRGQLGGLTTLSRTTLIFLILSGIATGLSWLFYFRALQMGEASLVAPIDKSSLALILVMSVIFLGEPLTWKSALAAILVTAGTLVSIWK
ncbi:MAG: EamA family transporter [Caldilineaceae bacterium]